MIFVTVGTHEQQFDRLVSEVDRLKGEGRIKEDVFMQVGFSSYVPKNCRWSQMLPVDKMGELMNSARIVITHGGPSSFLSAIQAGKVPIVVPRRKEFGEHVNNHQVSFCQAVAGRHHNIILVDDIRKLGDVIEGYEGFAGEMQGTAESNNSRFVREFTKIAEELVKK